MGGGFAPRFTVEAAFLILLAVGAGFADLRAIVIVAVMAGGWLLVALIEYFAWRQGPRFRAGFATATAPAARVEEEERVVSEPEREPRAEPASPPAEEQTAVTAARPETAPAEAEDRPQAALQFEQEQRARHRLEPLQPRPRRRWIIIGPRERPGEEPGSREEES
jgi:hypothetical protein